MKLSWISIFAVIVVSSVDCQPSVEMYPRVESIARMFNKNSNDQNQKPVKTSIWMNLLQLGIDTFRKQTGYRIAPIPISKLATQKPIITDNNDDDSSENYPKTVVRIVSDDDVSSETDDSDKTARKITFVNPLKYTGVMTTTPEADDDDLGNFGKKPERIFGFITGNRKTTPKKVIKTTPRFFPTTRSTKRTTTRRTLRTTVGKDDNDSVYVDNPDFTTRRSARTTAKKLVALTFPGGIKPQTFMGCEGDCPEGLNDFLVPYEE